MLDGGYQLKNVPKREQFKSKLNQEYPLIIKKHTGRSINVNNSLICLSNVKYIIEQKPEQFTPPPTTLEEPEQPIIINHSDNDSDNNSDDDSDSDNDSDEENLHNSLNVIKVSDDLPHVEDF